MSPDLAFIQAGFLRIKLEYLDRWNQERRAIANKYLMEITNPEIILPVVIEDVNPVWHLFVIRCKERDRLEKHLNDGGIETTKHYPISIHLQEAYKNLGYKEGDLTIAEEISETVLSLPMYYGINNEQTQYVIDRLNKFCSDK